jgi:hypothetical protein
MKSPTRKLPPLFLTTVMLVFLAVIMPNALRLPQQNPTPVVEYAPVPPDDNSAPNSGNVGSLALGSSSSLTDATGFKPPPGGARNPPQKHCVGNPPRQDEDPMAPPCVPFFTGDNGGATWQGVTKDEIRVVVYVEGGNTQYNGENAPPGGTWVDIDKAALPACPKQQTNPGVNACDHQIVRQTRALSFYFNHRYQTYGRHVHFYVYWGTLGDPAKRRQDAVVIYDKMKPFAVLDQAFWGGNNEAFEDALAARKVLVFTSQSTLRQAFFTKYPDYLWGFWPDTEHWADMYVTYLCTKIAPNPVAHMGNPPGSDVTHIGKPRKYGIFYTTDAGEPGLKHFRELVLPRIRKCGIDWGDREGHFPVNRFTTDVSQTGGEQSRAAARFKQEDVTTVLYLGGVENFWSQYAESLNYYPEIIIAGDLNQDNNVTARSQSQGVWANAWAVHFQVRFGNIGSTPGMRAYRTTYPSAPDDESRWVNELYRDHFMLFQAIQVAGPRLTPKKVSEGFHAIPPKASTDPYIASCFFDERDFSCVKDATEIWWDPTGVSPGDGTPGCWRMVDEGVRFLPGTWPEGDTVFRNGKNDPCTGFDYKRRQRL